MLNFKPDIRNFPDIIDSCQSIANLVGTVCNVPSSLIMRQNPKTMEVITSSINTDSPYSAGETEALGKGLYCETVIQTQQPLHVADALTDPDWNKNPDIKLGMIAYYGVPINWPDGSPFGTFCVLDKQSWDIDNGQKKLIKEFAAVIETLLKQAVNAEKLRHIAEHDDLTQLLSRGALLSRMKEAFDRFQRYHRPLSVIFMDIDHFKHINDKFGHATGDQLLRQFAKLTSSNLRQTDFIGRLGGEEFLICMGDTSVEAAHNQAERIRELIKDMTIESKDKDTSITISCGVTEALEADTRIENMIARADKALYEAKQNGRDQTVII